MRRMLAVVAVVSFVAVVTAQMRRTLEIYLVDVEGGNATLFVAPSGESLLIDTGNGGAAASRDGDRIMAAVKRRRATPDRSPHHDALSRGSPWRHGEPGRPDSDRRVHRSWPERAAQSGHRRIPDGRLSEVVRWREAHRRQAGGPGCQ